MAAKTIEVEYSIGEDVIHFTGVQGRITAIFHRGINAYEMSFCNNDGKPDVVIVAECELSSDTNGRIGFEKKE